MSSPHLFTSSSHYLLLPPPCSMPTVVEDANEGKPMPLSEALGFQKGHGGLNYMVQLCTAQTRTIST